MRSAAGRSATLREQVSMLSNPTGKEWRKPKTSIYRRTNKSRLWILWKMRSPQRWLKSKKIWKTAFLLSWLRGKIWRVWSVIVNYHIGRSNYTMKWRWISGNKTSPVSSRNMHKKTIIICNLKNLSTTQTYWRFKTKIWWTWMTQLISLKKRCRMSSSKPSLSKANLITTIKKKLMTLFEL